VEENLARAKSKDLQFHNIHAPVVLSI